ncbi:MAG: alpha/beta fold hydrolase [Betaproteobacteria bacterium]|nr:MAG: alpha/beta fold hydrolase [Betaproteobacteria bacterium]
MRRIGMERTGRVLLSIAFLSCGAAGARAADDPPLAIARDGFFYVGGKSVTLNGRPYMSGQMYVEFRIPAKQAHPFPIVMVHGGTMSGTNFTGTPDGREGWAQFFVRRGYAVYVVDQPGRGRSAHVAGVYGPTEQVDRQNSQRRYIAQEKYKLWPQAHLHTQWPGSGEPEDPVVQQLVASQLPAIKDFKEQQFLNRDALVALLDKIGPAALLVHSQAGAFGWPVADARPGLVKAILAIEPNGPPFYGVDFVGAPDYFRQGSLALTYGVSAVPLAYVPPVADASELPMVQQDKADGPDLVKCWMQKEPARQLPNLRSMPVLVLTAEASYHAPYDHCTVKYLRQSGVEATFIRLADLGIRGNSHVMMLEKNNREIAAVIARWLDQALPFKGR